MKNVNKKRRTESDIIIFKDCDSTVGALRNTEDIGVKEVKMHAPCKILFYFSAHEIQEGLRIWFIEMYPSFHQYIS